MGGGGQQYYLESGTIYNDNPLNSSGPVHRQQFSFPHTPEGSSMEIRSWSALYTIGGHYKIHSGHLKTLAACGLEEQSR